jgi:archaellum biogenesis protein FlaJ (TadC family)
MERVPTTSYFWVSRLAGFAGIVCVVIAIVTSVTHHHLRATPAEWIQIAIAAFVFAIWAVLYELRDRGIKTSTDL